jgi:hypothetical protein
MESRQLALCFLRALRSNEDDQAEAFYRHSIYAEYEASLSVFLTTHSSIVIATKAAEYWFGMLDLALARYLNKLIILDEHPTAYATPSHCLEGARMVTVDLHCDLLAYLGEGLIEDLGALEQDHWDVGQAIKKLCTAMDVSCRDMFLDRAECERVLEELCNREAELENCLGIMKIGLFDSQECVRRLCFVAAEFLKGSKMRYEAGIEDVLRLIGRIGDETGPDLDG